MNSPANSTLPTGKPETAPQWAVAMDRWMRYLTEDLGGGPRVIRIAQMINFHKVITVFLIYGMMVYFNNYSTAAWIYLALHGTYGYCWLIKDFSFRDFYFDRRVTFGGVAATYLGLVAWYWLLPFLFISGNVQPSNGMLWFCISLHTLGCVLMVAADLQKNIVLRLRKGLITDGVFTYSRNPNYLGEIMIYGSYALLVGHWAGWAVVFVVLARCVPAAHAAQGCVHIPAPRLVGIQEAQWAAGAVAGIQRAGCF